MNTEVTKAGLRALALLSVGPLRRNREGWVTAGGQFVALNTIAKLRKLGKVRVAIDKKSVHPK